MSRFALVKNHLYIITPTQLKVYDASACDHPNFIQTLDINPQFGAEAETVFGFEDLLLIGSTSGMFIYDNSNPDQPVQISSYDHVTACDPVVASGDYAYVTLRSGGINCPGWTNQMDLIDISNPYSPELVKSFPMQGPQGLGIDNNTLFLCDGDAGLKVYDIQDPTQVDQNKLAQHSDVNAYDVIPYNGVLIMSGSDGIVQYDYSNVNELKQLSLIPVR